jgi:hypothetical protein
MVFVFMAGQEPGSLTLRRGCGIKNPQRVAACEKPLEIGDFSVLASGTIREIPVEDRAPFIKYRINEISNLTFL